MYDFQTQLSKGESIEKELDRFFSDGFLIAKATQEQQRQGIDRLFLDRRTGQLLRVEYKADWKASRTGNAFVETISVDTTGKKGWALTTTADKVFYLLVDLRTLYVLDPQKVRERLPNWMRRFPTKQAANRTYSTHGVVVPLDEFEKIADAVIAI